jgi:hypothetical protein
MAHFFRGLDILTMAALVRIGEPDDVVPAIASLPSEGNHRLKTHPIRVLGGISLAQKIPPGRW